MTTPRDAIGLSDRLRFIAPEDDMPKTREVMLEAATQLDALQERVKELEASNRTANKWQQWAEDERAKYESRATRAEQERDEAMERLKPFADAAESLNESHLDRMDLWESPSGLEITAGHLRAARDLVRRLAAGTEKEKRE